jgi:hypothetical protein
MPGCDRDSRSLARNSPGEGAKRVHGRHEGEYEKAVKRLGRLAVGECRREPPSRMASRRHLGWWAWKIESGRPYSP